MIGKKYQDKLMYWKKHDFLLERVRISESDHVKFRYLASYKHPHHGFIYGYGESMWKSKALIIAANELLEREAFLIYRKRLGVTSTNGFASHDTLQYARKKARDELVERDAFLRHWLLEEPLENMVATSFKLAKINRSLKKMNHSSEYFKTTLGIEEVYVALVTNIETGGIIVGTALKENSKRSIEKALSEAYYTLHVVRKFPEIDWSQDNLLNNARYWYNRSIPTWWKGKQRTLLKTKNFEIRFEEVNSDPTYIVKAVADEAIELWTGHNLPEKYKQLVNKYGVKVNNQPHPLP